MINIIMVDAKTKSLCRSPSYALGVTATGPLVLVTDFGLADPWVGLMRGVIATVDPRVQVIDLTHAIPPQDIARGADVIAQGWRWFPAGSVFVGVVDPGVGSERAPLVARIDGRLFVGPDNGLCSRVAPDSTDARRLPESWGLPQRSATFHGRDLFAPAAARLATGAVRFEDAEAAPFVRLPPAPPGSIRAIDHFGNAITNLPGAPGGWVVAGDHRARVVRTYADGEPGELVGLTGSLGHLELAVPNGSAAAERGLYLGQPVRWEPA